MWLDLALRELNPDIAIEFSAKPITISGLKEEPASNKKIFKTSFIPTRIPLGIFISSSFFLKQN